MKEQPTTAQQKQPMSQTEIPETADAMAKLTTAETPGTDDDAVARHDDAEATKPELPAIKKQTFEDIMADLNKSPLFMTEMEENDDIAALQALSYEGTPLENGVDFKARGNECFKVRGYVDAREFYTKGIQILAREERARAGGETTKSPDGVDGADGPGEEVASQRAVLEALLVNRAACHLELGNFRSCWTDCAAALRLNPANVKACYRSARALLAVGRVDEADAVCARGLALDAGNAALRQTAREVAARARELGDRSRREAERRAVRARREQLLRAALKARNIATRTTTKGQPPPEMGGAKLELVPDPDDPRSSLAFPALLLYPEDLESDFIRAFDERQTLGDHLSYVLPLPWDRRGAYTLAGVSCYVETADGGVLKLGKRVPLLKVLGTGKVEVVDGLLRIYVLPNDRAAGWVETFKRAKKAELAARQGG
ncbi:uncharacterized protein UV8b_01190 [Ustilaginoidea virens]|uniref:Cns1/TTC4 wheel domain-containing protein n=1 Tax=Ustilaginoidea virens TaxID=1159556 RepID=A0A1B5L3T3_USTVR|nr:uncharacterized protein UV8b_01190 [Ustilaginoidea virens]QUC16949.1 hypothetical protein UV8b_01190 [Ustilaginoidea virens]GAO18153.1 hypothetical protein UVI_02036650 [Ustilaginoidea virens]